MRECGSGESGKISLSRPLSKYRLFLQGGYQGLVADGGYDTRRNDVGWTLNPSGRGNQWHVNAGAFIPVGFFQIGGGIAGDFSICAVPAMIQDLELEDTEFWGYFCQISDSTTSYGSYSGAIPNEKITWGKLDIDTPKFIVESDATIVAPLMFAYILGM